MKAKIAQPTAGGVFFCRSAATWLSNAGGDRQYSQRQDDQRRHSLLWLQKDWTPLDDTAFPKAAVSLHVGTESGHDEVLLP